MKVKSESDPLIMDLIVLGIIGFEWFLWTGVCLGQKNCTSYIFNCGVFISTGGPGLVDPCEKNLVDTLTSMGEQQREDITSSAQVRAYLIVMHFASVVYQFEWETWRRFEASFTTFILTGCCRVNTHVNDNMLYLGEPWRCACWLPGVARTYVQNMTLITLTHSSCLFFL